MRWLRTQVWLMGWLLTWAGHSLAQCPDRSPTTFTGALRATSTYGCVPLRVVCGNTQIGVRNVRYHYEYDRKRSSAPTTTDSVHAYTRPGQYFLVQYSEKEGLSMMSCAEVLVYDTLPPKIELTACGNRVSLTITDPLEFPMNYDSFVVDWGDGSTGTVPADQPGQSHVFDGTGTRRIRVQGMHQYGDCGGTAYQSFTPNQAATVRAVEPPTGSSIDSRVRVQIDNPGGLTLSLEQRVGSGSFQTSQAVPSGASVSVEALADTGQTTCYRVVPTRACPGQNPSPERCYMPPAREPRPTTSVVVYFPDAFSPNNDGLNDTFGPLGAVPVGSYELIIYDRWGRVIFSTTDPQQTWNGRIEGQLAPTGVYAYQLAIGQTSTQIHQKRGRLQLVR